MDKGKKIALYDNDTDIKENFVKQSTLCIRESILWGANVMGNSSHGNFKTKVLILNYGDIGIGPKLYIIVRYVDTVP